MGCSSRSLTSGGDLGGRSSGGSPRTWSSVPCSFTGSRRGPARGSSGKAGATVPPGPPARGQPRETIQGGLTPGRRPGVNGGQMNNGRRRVVITGVGAVTPIGTAADGLWAGLAARRSAVRERSEEHTSELQSQSNLVCRLLLEKKKKIRLTEADGACETY